MPRSRQHQDELSDGRLWLPIDGGWRERPRLDGFEYPTNQERVSPHRLNAGDMAIFAGPNPKHENDMVE